MSYKIDNLQYCNWNRDVFKINHEASLDAVHVTIVYHEDFDELLVEIKKWDELFKNNSKERVVADFIAGMTDRYAINLYKKIK